MLQEVTDVVTEKEVRFRTPLEELDLLLASKNKMFKDAEIKEADTNVEANGEGSDKPNEGQNQGMKNDQLNEGHSQSQTEIKNGVSGEVEISSRLPSKEQAGDVTDVVLKQPVNSTTATDPPAEPEVVLGEHRTVVNSEAGVS